MKAKKCNVVLVSKNRLRDVRLLTGMTQTELGRAVGVSKNTICSIELGRSTPNVYLALRIANALDEQVDFIFYFEVRR